MLETEEPINNINLTSLVDVSLTLVIIFMVVAPFMMQIGIKVTSSKMGASKGRVAEAENVSVTLSADRQIKVNGKTVSWDNLSKALYSALNKSRNKMVMILASEKNQVRDVVEILDCSRQQGALRLAIMKKYEKTN